MVVYYVEDTSNAVTVVPRREQWNLLSRRLSPAQFNNVVAYINSLIGDSDIETSNWMPKDPNWEGTPLQVLFDVAARKNFELSAQLFGLMVFYTFMTREDHWITGRFFSDGEPMRGRTYFKRRY
ncbi:hypothetical protein OOZ54_15405 [Rhodopseudomonas palustris]|uniref:hypothetical protein n=1 Tax=Rhodopseudomonas palustris TaxID=1076 RepID=UPI0022F10971|nr:hypothetical protein [Rhodopseudomonas palustris]WBU28048.1 hypothetical protein OOZ54_15405 [Rhodopseudomonas palustris]